MFVLVLEDDWESRWVISEFKKSDGLNGQWLHTAGKWYGNPDDKGAFKKSLFFPTQKCCGSEMQQQS
jgi:hypothetical protein